MKFVKVSLVGVFGLALAGVAAANDAQDVKQEVKFVKEFKIGAEYRAGLTYDDKKFAGDDAEATMLFDLEHARLNLNAVLGDDVKAVFSYDLLENEVKSAYAGYNAGAFTLNIGKKKVAQGGFTQKAEAYDGIGSDFQYSNILPFDSYAAMAELQFDLAGKLSVQLINEVLGADVPANNDDVDAATALRAYDNDKQKNPTLAVEWMGDFGGWKPLVQVGAYAKFKGLYGVLGVEGEVAGFNMQLDAIYDQADIAINGFETDKKVMAFNGYFSYDIGNTTPFLEAHFIQTKLDGNKVYDNLTDGFYNGTELALGALCNSFGDYYTPYAAVTYDMAKDAQEDSEKNLKVKVGVYGKF